MPVPSRKTVYSVVEADGTDVGEFASLLDARKAALEVPGRKVRINQK